MTVTSAAPRAVESGAADGIEGLLRQLEDGADSVGAVIDGRVGPDGQRQAPSAEERVLAGELLRALLGHLPRLDEALVARYRELEDRGRREPALEAQALRRDDVARRLHELEVALADLPPPREEVAVVAPRRRGWVVAGSIVTAIGALLVGFVVFELWVTDLYEQRSQDALVGEFRQVLFVATAGEVDPNADVGFGEFVDVLEDEEVETDGPEVVPYEPAAKGSATALIRIPTLDVEKVVVEGTGANELKEGPGRYRGGPLPGQPGNAIVVGHRTTYGAPFRDLDELEANDPIEVITPQGIFTYRVVENDIVRPGDPDVLEQGDENLLTLVTSYPEYQATSRLIVRAELVGDPVLPPDEELEARRKGIATPLTPDENGLTADITAWVWVLLWAELLVVAVVVTRRLYRRWQRWPTWLITTPVLIALTFLLYESLDRLLPSTL